MPRCHALRLFVALLSVCATASAQQGAPETTAYSPAQRVETGNPSYPTAALAAGREGWVTLSFIISPTGEVTEPMIVESSHEIFDRPSLDAVRRWRYEPARRNGEAVEEAMVETTIRFRVEGATGARSLFRRRYAEISELLRAGDFPGAAMKLDELESGGRLNLYEDAWFWFAKALYLEAVESPDVEARIQALQRAIGADELYLAPELFVTASQRLYALHAQRGEVGAAVRVFERLRDFAKVQKADNYGTNLASMQPSYDRITAAVAGAQIIGVPAKIGTNSYWVEKLLRRRFGIDSVQGRVDVVDIRCKVGTGRFGFSEEQVWTVPKSWEDCRLYVKGEPGTTFRLLAYPDDAAAVSQAEVDSL